MNNRRSRKHKKKNTKYRQGGNVEMNDPTVDRVSRNREIIDNDDDEDSGHYPMVTLFDIEGKERDPKTLVEIVINGISGIFIPVSTGSDVSIMLESLWLRVSQEGTIPLYLDTNRRGKIKHIFGEIIHPLGTATLSTQIDGHSYDVDWVVIPEAPLLRTKASLGVDFLSKVSWAFKDGFIIKPRQKPKQSNNIEELVKREVEKIKKEVDKRAEALKKDQQRYIEEQMQNIINMVKNQKL